MLCVLAATRISLLDTHLILNGCQQGVASILRSSGANFNSKEMSGMPLGLDSHHCAECIHTYIF